MGSYHSRAMDLDSGSESSDNEMANVYCENLLRSIMNSRRLELMDDCYNKVPKEILKLSTTTLDNSEFALITRIACGLGEQSKKFRPSQNIFQMILNREKGLYAYTSFSNNNMCNIRNHFLPNTRKDLDRYAGKVFCGIFSRNGEYFVTASQDRELRLYNSSYKKILSISAHDMGWSIIDVAFNNACDKFVYSSWSSSLHICSTNDEHQTPLNLTDTGRRFCIFSVEFSSCDTEILGGANDGELYIFNLEQNRRVLRLPAHKNDINSVAFADSNSHIFYTGSDDGLIKVWDRRSLDESCPKPVGLLAGHRHGITFIDSRKDGRHLISNSKDQSIKLWDIRVLSGEDAVDECHRTMNYSGWDYRWQQIPRGMFPIKSKLKCDTSLMTYTGHTVTQSLVRCRFSPAETTGQRFIYTGSGTGDLIIYDALTGEIEEFLHGHADCVRDVYWHPYQNEIVTSSWDGIVGRWIYIGEEESKPPTPRGVRRSLRIALKRKKH